MSRAGVNHLPWNSKERKFCISLSLWGKINSFNANCLGIVLENTVLLLRNVIYMTSAKNCSSQYICICMFTNHDYLLNVTMNICFWSLPQVTTILFYICLEMYIFNEEPQVYIYIYIHTHTLHTSTYIYLQIDTVIEL